MFRALITATAMGAAALGAGAVPASAAPPAVPVPRPAVGAGAMQAFPEPGHPAGPGQARPGDAAAPAGAVPARKTQLTLSYMAEAGYARAVVLTCNPPGGGHPKPVKACNTLSKVGGTPTGLKPARTMCMMIYAPITAQVSGSWKGSKIKWAKKYGNSCEMNRANGILFDF